MLKVKLYQGCRNRKLFIVFTTFGLQRVNGKMLERLVGKRRLSGLALALALGGSGLSCGSEPVKTPPEIGVVDSDNDGMPDEAERRMGTNPLNKDSDNDGFDDLYEVQHGTDPMNPDDPTKNNPDAGSLDAMVEEYDSGRHPDAHISDNGYDAGVRPDTGHYDAETHDAGESMYPICRIGGPYEININQWLKLNLSNRACGCSYDPPRNSENTDEWRVEFGNGAGVHITRIGRVADQYYQEGNFNLRAICINQYGSTTAETTVNVVQ